ncbi:class I SAM-dependent methyltransferase [Methanobrevibacter sp. DSM 116169]|uniref:class I SAM-dependent methyltransferase n=1 Tax=Methanobrevibacter sp. DSM 116169 TaxID=3242727 RepID=UPI0038FCFAEF
MINKKTYIERPEDVDWVYFWKNALENKKDKDKDWNEAAPHFNKRAKKDSYLDFLFSKLILSNNDTVLDLGCGEGTVTIPIAKKVKSVTGLDSAYKMLEILEENSKKEGISNINTILTDVEDISKDKLGSYDIIVASRSLNGIIPIDEILFKINEIASKYVFITVFGPENWKIEKEFKKEIGLYEESFPEYNYFFNILFNMGIYPNIERFNNAKYREYNTIEEAMDNGKFRLDLLDDNQKEDLRKYLKKILKKDPKSGKLYNEKDKADWILIWWEK